ncbi:MAG: hypothetical protein HYV07_27795 [Deltaproteobacteria bacterium]|nr:hypothetical protein [Deltaproteobacteria bacterium]
MAPTSCAGSHLAVAREHQARGQLSIANEYLEAGLERAPEDEELRDALLEVRAILGFELQRDVERLEQVGRPLAALSRALWSEELLALGTARGVPADVRAELAKQASELEVSAGKLLQRSLDEGAERGAFVRQDLETCRTLHAMRPSDEMLGRRCEQMKAELGIHAALEASGEFGPELAQRILAEIGRAHPELLSLVEAKSSMGDATFSVEVDSPVVFERPWTLVEQLSTHAWVRRLDERGRAVREDVEVEENGQKVVKTLDVYDHVPVEYRTFETRREVSAAYRATLRDLRTDRVVASFAGRLAASSASRYHDRQGDERARIDQNTPEGLENAAPLSSSDELVRSELPFAAAEVSRAVLARIE